MTTLDDHTYNKPKRIPLAQDIKLLNTHLQGKATKLCASLKQEPTEKHGRDLAEVTLTQITLFNRRRGGEMERLKQESYNNSLDKNYAVQEEIEASLSPFELKLSKTIKRIETRGKRGRKVAILLTKAHQEQIEILNQTRIFGKIDTDNLYEFPRPGESKTPLRSSDVLRKFSLECGATKPEFLTSTSLRKHIAIITQLLNLKEHELDILAGFMGHDIKIHREYYRLPEDTLQLVKVSKLLISIENGNVQECKGKSLDQIEVNAGGSCLKLILSW